MTVPIDPLYCAENVQSALAAISESDDAMLELDCLTLVEGSSKTLADLVTEALGNANALVEVHRGPLHR
jgi:hypothetical protein